MKSLYKLYHVSRDYILILCGVLSAGLGLRGFLLPSEFTDGGITGISILTSIATGIPLSLLIFIFNIPFLYFGYKQLSLLFTLKTLLGITALALCTYFIPYPVITHDKLLIAVFGGFFLGTGIGLAIRGGGVIDGMALVEDPGDGEASEVPPALLPDRLGPRVLQPLEGVVAQLVQLGGPVEHGPIMTEGCDGLPGPDQRRR